MYFTLWFNILISTFLHFTPLILHGPLFFFFDLFKFQVIPQAICTRYGLAVGANFVWLVRILMIICYPIAYPIGKVITPRGLELPVFLVYGPVGVANH